MVEVKKYDAGSGQTASAQVDEKPFGRVLARSLKNAVVMYEAHQRQGSVQTKERSDVRGTSKKPFKQKGTGRARAGDVKSPIWRGGGTIFGPHPRDYTWRMPKKMRRAALRSAIAGKLESGTLLLADGLSFDAPSSKQARKVLDETGTRASCLIVIDAANDATYRSFRNFPRVSVKEAKDVNAYDICYYRHVLATPASMEQLSSRVGLSPKKLGA